jgi:two-component system OmpR family response regulator
MRILVVEDEKRLAAAVCEHLRADGNTVDWFKSLDESHAAVATTVYDLVLLDLQLPDGFGLDFLKSLRQRGNTTPTLVVTARDQIRDRIAGLKAGADDYIVKPFDLDELSARIEAVTRRSLRNLAEQIQIGEIDIDLQSHRVQRGETTINLTRREWALLECLARRRNQIVQTDILLDALYSFDVAIESNALAVHINRIRAKLGQRVITTHRGIGYALGHDV